MTSTLSNDLLQFGASSYEDPHDFLRVTPLVDTYSHVGTLSLDTTGSDDSSLTKDDLVFLSDLFDYANPTTTGSTVKPKQAASPLPHGRKRPRSTKPVSPRGRPLPKSQQQRQKLEIESLRQQVVELQARIDDLRARKLERKRQKLQQRPVLDTRPAFINPWATATTSHVVAVQQLEEQNEKLRSQVAAHLGELQQLERFAQTHYLGNDVLAPMQHVTGPPATHYYSTSY